MNENLEKDKIQLGGEKPQLLPSKSLLNTIKLGYNVKPVPPPPANHIDFIEGDSVMTTISTGFEHNDKPVPPPPANHIDFIEGDSVMTTISTGFEHNDKPVPPPPANHIDFIEGDSVMTTISTGFEHNDKPVPPPPEINLGCKIPKKKNPDSVIGSIDTGFGCDNQIVIDCPKPKYKTHLCKENYLGEFKTESEKTLARNNLGVYSKEEIDKIVGQIVENNNNNFITRKEVQNMIANLDFVDSTLKSYADYQIPNNLFKL